MASLDYLFANGGWEPKVLNTVSGSDGVEESPAITTTTYTTVLNASGSGFLTYLGISRNLDVEVYIDGNLRLFKAADYDLDDSVTHIIGSAKSNMNNSSLPPLKYNSSILIQAKRPTGTQPQSVVRHQRAINTGV